MGMKQQMSEELGSTRHSKSFPQRTARFAR